MIIRVFREDPVWGQYTKWWMVPLDTLKALHLATYRVEDDDEEADLQAAITEVRARHPHDVLVY